MTDTDDTTATRRSILKLSPLAGVLATGALATAQSGGKADLFVGDDADAGFRHGVWSFGPESFPPDEAAWVKRGGAAPEFVYEGSLPTTFTSAGIQWSLASDLATAESNVTQRPAIAVASDGTVLLTDGPPPTTWTGAGVEHVVASDLSAAENARSQRPAVLFSADTSGDTIAEVVV